jgi:hypothetical protein
MRIAICSMGKENAAEEKLSGREGLRVAYSRYAQFAGQFFESGLSEDSQSRELVAHYALTICSAASSFRARL